MVEVRLRPWIENNNIMDIKITNQTKTEIDLEIMVSAEVFTKFFDKALTSMGKNLELKGFRRGNAPKEVVEEHFQTEKVLLEAADLAVNETYKQAIQEKGIDAIFLPKVEIKKLAKGNEFVYTAKVSILPKIEVPNYKEIASKVKRNEVKIEEKEVEQALTYLQKSRAKLVLKEAPAQKGDFVQIEYMLTGKPEAEPIKDGFILGEGRLLPGFEEKLIGMKADDEKKGVELDSNGQKFVVDVKVTAVQDMQLPEINDEFAKSVGQFENLASLKKNIKEGITVEKKQQEIQKMRFETLEAISQKTDIELPLVLIENEQKQMLEGLKQQVAQNLKVEFKDYLEKIKKTEEEIMTSLKTEAEKKIKNFLILKEIGEKEGVNVSDEEVVEEANKTLSTFPSVEEAEKQLGNIQRFKDYTREVIKNEKIFAILDQLIK